MDEIIDVPDLYYQSYPKDSLEQLLRSTIEAAAEIQQLTISYLTKLFIFQSVLMVVMSVVIIYIISKKLEGSNEDSIGRFGRHW